MRRAACQNADAAVERSSALYMPGVENFVAAECIEICELAKISFFERETIMPLSTACVSLSHRLSQILAKLLYNDDFIKINNSILSVNINKNLITNNIITLLIVAEDKRFFDHCGFDIIAIIRAIVLSIFKNEKSGASTIDQQLVRTITQNKEKTFKRKIKEIILASAIGNIYEKEIIAAVYLTIAYYGWNMHGINSAYSRIKSENILDGDDIEYIAVALLKYPFQRYMSKNPIGNIKNRISYIKLRLKKLNKYFDRNKIGVQYEIE